MVAIRPLTSTLRGAAAHVYLAATKKDQHKEDIRVYNELNLWFMAGFECYNLGEHASYIEKVIKSTRRYKKRKVINPSSQPQQSSFFLELIEADTTELPGINDALNEISDEYYVWLISNLPDRYCRIVEKQKTTFF